MGPRSSHALPAPDRCIDVKRVELYGVGAAARALGGEDRRPASAEGIEDYVVALCRIQDRVGDHRDRLSRRMKVERFFLAFSAKAIGSWVIPHVSAIAPELAKLNVVDMPSFAWGRPGDRAAFSGFHALASAPGPAQPSRCVRGRQGKTSTERRTKSLEARKEDDG